MTRTLTVFKVGGSVLERGDAGEAVLDRVAASWSAGEALLLVHGGGAELSRWLERLGIASRFSSGQRVTTPEMLPIALMVLGGLINRRLVEALLRRGCPAVGVTGADGAGTVGVPADGGGLGAVGTVASVNAPFYADLIGSRRLPVVASLAWSPEHGWLNVNADLMAAALAAGLRARRLWLMTETPGVLTPHGAPLAALHDGDIDRLIAAGEATDGMVPKLLACRAALRGRVPEVRILGPDGTGTRVLREGTIG
ncbi:MAG: acetylglutamate kinase [Candidatus Polarisedimenticolia bacterium]